MNERNWVYEHIQHFQYLWQHTFILEEHGVALKNTTKINGIERVAMKETNSKFKEKNAVPMEKEAMFSLHLQQHKNGFILYQQGEDP